MVIGYRTTMLNLIFLFYTLIEEDWLVKSLSDDTMEVQKLDIRPSK